MEDQFKPSDEVRLKDGKEANAHYKSINLPGDRTYGVDVDDVRARIAEMAKVKALPNHD